MKSDAHRSIQSIVAIEGIVAMKAFAGKARQEGKSIGFVPTMGALHAGHQSLIRRAKQENDLVVVSVFVNPLQFGPSEDFERYPRDRGADELKIAQAGGDVFFSVSPGEMYPAENFSTFVVPEGAASRWEGAVRPGHFRGVLTVVLKLFEIVKPRRAYFGRKDAQQLFLIEKMARDFHLDLEIVPCPTVREADGLAMSSRNAYLSQEQRRSALTLHLALRAALELYRKGERDAAKLVAQANNSFSAAPELALDYLALVDPASFQECHGTIARARMLVAVRIGKTRLIDNLLLSAEDET